MRTVLQKIAVSAKQGVLTVPGRSTAAFAEAGSVRAGKGVGGCAA
jgi:hypothetical protein